jgi:6,7-dimethyl-8-ribityllumazine synthase
MAVTGESRNCVTLATQVPITFGIITTYTDEQAIARSRDDSHNKGREAACVESLKTIAAIKSAK